MQRFFSFPCIDSRGDVKFNSPIVLDILFFFVKISLGKWLTLFFCLLKSFNGKGRLIIYLTLIIYSQLALFVTFINNLLRIDTTFIYDRMLVEKRSFLVILYPSLEQLSPVIKSLLFSPIVLMISATGQFFHFSACSAFFYFINHHPCFYPFSDELRGTLYLPNKKNTNFFSLFFNRLIKTGQKSAILVFYRLKKICYPQDRAIREKEEESLAPRLVSEISKTRRFLTHHLSKQDSNIAALWLYAKWLTTRSQQYRMLFWCWTLEWMMIDKEMFWNKDHSFHPFIYKINYYLLRSSGRAETYSSLNDKTLLFLDVDTPQNDQNFFEQRCNLLRSNANKGNFALKKTGGNYEELYLQKLC